MFKLFKLSYELLTLLVACLMHAVITLYCLIYFASFVHYKIKKKKKKKKKKLFWSKIFYKLLFT